MKNRDIHHISNRLLRVAILSSAILLMTSCTNDQTEPKPIEVTLRLLAGENLNQGTHTRPLGQVLKIYHLRSSERFEQISFDSLLDTDEAEKQLGTDLIDSREVLLVPEQRYESHEIVDADTRFIGVVAFFRQPAARRWRLVYSTKDSETSGITIGIHACAMTSTQGALITQVPGGADSLTTIRCSAP